MSKVVRAFSLDQAVSEDLDFQTFVPGNSKPGNKSKYVNEALRFYMGKNIKEMIEQNRTLKENLTAGLRAKDAFIQGLEGHIASLEARIMELNHEIRDLQAPRGLLGRLWRLLRKRE